MNSRYSEQERGRARDKHGVRHIMFSAARSSELPVIPRVNNIFMGREELAGSK